MTRQEAIKMLGAAVGFTAWDRSGATLARGAAPQVATGQVLSVRDLGARGDGRTDDTDAFERGASALARSGGGILDVPPGAYVLRTVWLRTGTWLRGAGAGRSVLRRAHDSISGLGPNTNVVSAGSVPGSPYGDGDGARDVWVTDIEVDGNAAGQASTWDGSQSGDSVGGAAIDLRFVANVVLDRVYAHHAITEGIRLWMCPSAHVRTCRSAHNGIQVPYSGRGNGFNIQGDLPDASNAEMRRFTLLVQCEADHNGDEGFEADLVTDLAFIGCASHHNGFSSASTSSCYGFELTGGALGSPPYPARVMVLGCMAEQNVRAGATANAGLQVNSLSPVQQLLIDDFLVYGQTGRAVGLDLKGSVGQVTLSNIMVDGWGAVGSGEHAIFIQAGTDCHLRSVVLSGITIHGTPGAGLTGITLLTKGTPSGTIEGLAIANCSVEGAGSSGIALLGNVAGFSLTSCMVARCGGHGLHLYPNGAGNTMADGLVNGCVLVENAGAGVMVGMAAGAAGVVQRLRVSGCVARRNGEGIHLSPIAEATAISAMNLGENTRGQVIDQGLWNSMETPRVAQRIPAAPTVRVDALAGEDVEVGPLTSDALIAAPANASRGARLNFFVGQDARGGHAVRWDPIFRVAWSDTGNAAGRSSQVSFRFQGAQWVQLGPQGPYV